MSSGISSTKEQAGHGSPFLSFSVVFNHYFLPDNLIDLMDTTDAEKQKYSINEGDIFLTRTSETVDELAMSSVALKDYPEASFSGFLKRLRPVDKTIVYPKFMAFYLRSPLFRRTIINNTVMTLRASFNEAMFSYLGIMLPDFDTQKKIGDFLYSLEKKKQINNQINQELEAMAKTLYDYWFVQFDFPDQNGKPYKSSGGKMVYNPELKREIPEGWGVEKLKDKLSVSRGISYKTENIKDNIGTPMINLASIDINRNYKSTGLKYFNGEYLKEKIVSGGDLLIACTDLTRNADIVGSPIIVPFDEQKYVFSMDLAKIDSKVDFINKYYLYSTLRTEHYHNYIKKWASGTNVLHLNLDGMNWYSISVPPIELQEEYSQIILNFSKKTNKNIQENQELTQLRDWLLPMLMNGQMKVE